MFKLIGCVNNSRRVHITYVRQHLSVSDAIKTDEVLVGFLFNFNFNQRPRVSYFSNSYHIGDNLAEATLLFNIENDDAKILSVDKIDVEELIYD